MNSAQERYAFIALLFLVVVVSVVAFWDDGDGQDPVQAATRDDAVQVDAGAYGVEPGATDLRPWDAVPAGGGLDSDAGSIALAGLDEDVPVVPPVSTRGQAYADHSQGPRDGLGESGRDPYGADPYGADPYGADSYGAESYGADPYGEERGATTEDDRALASSEPMRPTRGDDLALSSAGARRPMRLMRDETVDPPSARESAAPAVTPVAAAPRSGAATRDYVVRAGDVLSTIASRECGTASLVNEIVRLNGLSNPDKIFEGMKLQLPARKANDAVASVPTVRSPKAGTARADGRPVVTVQRGQMLGVLLQDRYGTVQRSLPLVVQLNPGLNPDRVREGQTLVLPRFDEVEGANRRRSTGAAEEPRLARSDSPSQAKRGAATKGDRPYVR